MNNHEDKTDDRKESYAIRSPKDDLKREILGWIEESKLIGPANLTPQAYAAIHLRIPESGIDWLDKMIVKAERRNFVAKALPGLIGGLMRRYGQPGYDDGGMIHETAIRCFEMADAMIAERTRKQ